MKVLLLGGRGFVGRAVHAALRRAGHDVASPRLDFEALRLPRAWRQHLEGMDAVVNAAGIFRETGTRTFDVVHDEAPRALFGACEAAGVRRVIQISALGADEGARSRFHLSKKRADDDLARRGLRGPLEWAVVQPSLVFGLNGGSARLFCLLASLPVVPLPGNGTQRVQPIHVEDLAMLITRLVDGPPTRARIAAVGPRALSIREWLALLRSQMGLRATRFLPVPAPLVKVVVGNESFEMLERGNTSAESGEGTRPPEDFITSEEKPFLLERARLDATLPVLRVSIAAMWIWSGFVSFGLYPEAGSLSMLGRVGLEGMVAKVALYGAAAFDVALGVATIFLRTQWLWLAQLALIGAYTIILSVFLPELWLHPFGPVMKNVPIAAAIALLLALEGRR